MQDAVMRQHRVDPDDSRHISLGSSRNHAQRRKKLANLS
jgi:hypothetical protein